MSQSLNQCWTKKKKVLGNGHDTNTSVTKKQVFKTDIRNLLVLQRKKKNKQRRCLFGIARDPLWFIYIDWFGWYILVRFLLSFKFFNSGITIKMGSPEPGFEDFLEEKKRVRNPFVPIGKTQSSLYFPFFFLVVFIM